MRRALRIAELLAQRGEGRGVGVVAVDVAQQRAELVEGLRVDPAVAIGG